MSKSAINIGLLNIWFVLGLALLMRALLPILGYCYTHDVTIFYTPDTASYVVPARELIAHHWLFSGGVPEIIRTPGYPLLLAVGLLLGRLELATITLQILLSCFTVFMVYRTACLLFEREEIAIIAAALYAIDPLSILFASLLAAETLFTALVRSAAQRVTYMNKGAEHLLLDSPLTYARIYFDGLILATFDLVSTEFLRFFNLYPKQGELLTVDVDKGVIASIEALLSSPILFWSIAVLLPLQLMYRHPWMPIICVLAGYGPGLVWNRLRLQFQCFPSSCTSTTSGSGSA